MITIEQIGGMLTIVVVTMMIVPIAMLLDLVSGLYKAKLQEIRFLLMFNQVISL